MRALWIEVFVFTCFLCWSSMGSSDFACKNFYRNRCYEVTSSATNGFQAAINCANNGGILATIKDQETQNFLLTLLNKGSTYWIGLRIVSGIVAFSDGSAFLHGSFAPWASGYKTETSYKETKCVYLNPTDQSWNAYDCTYEVSTPARNSFSYGSSRSSISSSRDRRYICEFKVRECPVQSAVIPNGRKECSDRDVFQPFEELYIECNSGYFLQGNSTIICQPNGEWNTLPRCIAGCKVPIITESTTLLNPQEGYSVGQTARLLCEDGFFGVGEEMKNRLDIRCQTNGTWSDSVPECHKFDDYQKISLIPKATEVLANKHKNITLNCPNSKTIHSIIWLKNGRKLISTNYKHQMNNNSGCLTIQNFSQIDEGFYSCILKNNQLILSVTYNVKMKVSDKCSNTSRQKVIYVDQNEDCFLQCGNTSSSEVRWYKNKQRIWGKSRQAILLDGTFILQKVQKSDEGDYTCFTTDLSLHCTQEFKITLFLNGSYSELECGIKNDNVTTPWFVSFWYPTHVVPFCYGTLIDDKWILTTASCVFENYRSRFPGFQVKLNIQKENLIDVEITSIGVSKIKIHPQYSSRLRSNDIALVKLKSSILTLFKKETKLSPICLPEKPKSSCRDETKVEGYVSGLGSLNSESIYSRRERMYITPSKQCPIVTSKYNKIFCASANDTNNENIFAGDTGSPFEINTDGRWVLWGIYNYGDRATLNGNMDYFLTVKYFLDWINVVRG